MDLPMTLLYTPQKRSRQPSDSFFSEGDIEARGHWLKKQVCRSADAGLSERLMAIVIEEEAEKLKTKSPIICLQAPCGRLKNLFRFPTTSAYEAHYNATHRWVCSECKAIFPAEKWLVLHLNEFHDSLRQVMKERGEKIYECYVTGCAKKCSTPKMRRLHLIDKHKYPRSFQFSIVKTGVIPFRDRRKRKVLNPGGNVNAPRNANTMDVAVDIESDATSISSLGKRSPSPSQDTQLQAGGVGMDVDELVEGMAKLRIPKSISFGRGARSAGWFGPGTTGTYAVGRIAGADRIKYGKGKGSGKGNGNDHNEKNAGDGPVAGKMEVEVEVKDDKVKEPLMNRRERRKPLQKKDVEMESQ